MPSKLRIASFNVENLFSRAKVLNHKDQSVGTTALGEIGTLRASLAKKTYTPAVKKRILALHKKLRKYITIREDRGKLFRRKGYKIVGVQASGADRWDGAIDFKRAKFSDTARANTARVIKDVRAQVACIVEAESRPTLASFASQMLGSRFPFRMLIDAKDPRGIDVGLLSKYPLGEIRTHMWDKAGGKRIFSRDCLEVDVLLPGGRKLAVLCNHFKSRGYGTQRKNDLKREGQALRVAGILNRYDLKRDWVVVAGDLNDSPHRPPQVLKPLLTVANLFDVLALQFPNAPADRWTYHYKACEQIDYILVSKPLRDRFRKAGVERRGIYDLDRITAGVEKEYPTVTHWSNQASDHGAVWAEFGV